MSFILVQIILFVIKCTKTTLIMHAIFVFNHWIYLKNKDFMTMDYYKSVAVAFEYDDLATGEVH